MGQLKYFTGSSTHKVDAKGRVSLPADFRKVLESFGASHIVVLPQMQRNEAHVGLSPAGYDKVIEQAEAMGLEYEDADAMSMSVLTDARQIPVDDAGRIVLSKDLRDQLGIGGEIRFVGRGSSFEMWEPATRASHESEIQPRAREISRSIKLTGLH
ncbi:MAG TPA: hypothetical protein VLA52_07950 [Thermohalobaculum sp.]|nr:hypothetical protein [Thermohalobaculum sp.]